MIPLAAIEGKLVFIAIALVVGVINAWLEKKKKDSGAGSPQTPAAPRAAAPGSAGNESEQERLNRFLQALGVPQQPAQSRPQPPRQAPAITKPQPQAQAVVRARDRRPQIARTVAKPAQKIVRRPVQPVVTVPEEMHRAGRIEEAASSIERISGEIGAMNVRVAMEPVQTLDRPAHLATANAGTTSVLERGGNPLVASLRRTLTNPTEIRAAFLASELLGPPRGLQR